MNFRLLACALGALLTAASASAQVTVINSVPYTISTSGKYRLGGNFVTAGPLDNAILINAPNVILDLGGFFVSGPGGDTTSQQGVIVVNNFSNVTIRNGTVANNGFGIFFVNGTNSINHLVEKLNVTRCYRAGVFFAGNTDSSIIRNNTFSQIGGATPIGGGVNNLSSYAIQATDGLRVERNSITGVSVLGNGTAVGIYSPVGGTFVIGNAISNSTIGVFQGKYQSNLTFGCSTPFQAGTDAGRNF